MSLVLNHSRAKGTAKLVLIGIANHDGDGGSWPTIATLARYANTSERSVQRALEQLVELGELEVKQNAGGTHQTPNDRRPNRYRITIKRSVENHVGPSSHGVTLASPRDVDGVTLVTQRGDASVVNGVTPASPEPSLNHPDPAAAAAAATPTDVIDELRYAFARTPDLHSVSFTMRADQRDELANLIDVHGVRRLVRAASVTNAGRVRRATAFFDTWRNLIPATELATPQRREHFGPTCPECHQLLAYCTSMNERLAAGDRCTQGHQHDQETTA